MKSLVRWGTTLGLVGSTLLATVLGGNLSALALPEEQIVKTLDGVPVYVVTDPQGAPLTRTLSPQNGQNQKNAPGAVTTVFFSRQEAVAFVNQLQNMKDKDPKMQEMVKKLQVTAVPLGAIYQQARKTANQPNRLAFAFKPVEQDVNGAMTLLNQSGQKVTQFAGSPVFFVTFGPNKGYVSIKASENGKEFVPAFLSKVDAVGLLNQVKQKFPQATIQVVDVEGIIQTLREKNDEWLKQVVLVPSQESREYISKLPRNGGNQAAPAQNQRPANNAKPQRR